jgi:hypothetical protein
MKFPVRALAVLAAGILLGTVLAPVAAQQTTPKDGLVALRSDGAVYLLLNGQRRWVAPQNISDDELNAMPEGEPIYAGLVPADSGFTPRASSPSSTEQSREQPQSNDKKTPTPTKTSSNQSSSSSSKNDNDSDASGSSSDVAIEEITFDEEVKQGQDWSFEATVSKKKKGKCELEVEWPDKEKDKDDKTPDSHGICDFSVEAPSGVKTGTAKWTLVFRDGDKKDEEKGEFKVKKT